MSPDSRDGTRELFLRAWRKYRAKEELEGVERLIVAIELRHPEYHVMLDNPESVARDFSPDAGESNPFLHMGMHIAIEESVTTNRPAGIADLYRSIVRAAGDEHEAQHRIMECLGETLWEAGRSGVAPDEARYMECLRRLVHTKFG